MTKDTEPRGDPASEEIRENYMISLVYADWCLQILRFCGNADGGCLFTCLVEVTCCFPGLVQRQDYDLPQPQPPPKLKKPLFCPQQLDNKRIQIRMLQLLFPSQLLFPKKDPLPELPQKRSKRIIQEQLLMPVLQPQELV